MMVGILGFAQTGKDEVARLLADSGFVRIAFADHLKRVVRDLFNFTYEQMWGTKEQKESPDERYPREHTWKRGGGDITCLCCSVRHFEWRRDGTQCYLNGRYALKIIGTEGARHCYDSIWGERAIGDGQKALDGWHYVKE